MKINFTGAMVQTSKNEWINSSIITKAKYEPEKKSLGLDYDTPNKAGYVEIKNIEDHSAAQKFIQKINLASLRRQTGCNNEDNFKFEIKA